MTLSLSIGAILSIPFFASLWAQIKSHEQILFRLLRLTRQSICSEGTFENSPAFQCRVKP
jgi:hypothetical protein